MFTGLIETNGAVDRISPRGPGAELVIRASQSLVSELVLGESVAVDGACLTVTHTSYERFSVDASAETMERTTLGERRVGDQMHLERALRLGDRLGGHWVTGHIDGVGSLKSRTPFGEACQLWFDTPPNVTRYLINKGSIAIDGASLTVNEVDEQSFSVVLIPHTLSILNLIHKKVGAPVNLEADILGKYVERLLGDATSPKHSTSTSQLNLSTLAKAGFIR
jgi:riboflavin synthase